jgi:2-dehydropantoate 2-reductase
VKIAVFGAGAIGSYLGAALTRAGASVTMIARGAQLEAIKARGLTLIEGASRTTVHPEAKANPRDAGIQDYVFVTLKSHIFPDAAHDIASLVGPHTVIITAMNGIPYWYFYGPPSPWRDRIVESVDPSGQLWRTLPPRHAIGCVLFPWAHVLEPGVVEQHTSNRFVLGEPDGTTTPRVQALAAIMEKGGLDAPISPRIRDPLWFKLWGNLSMNPLSTLTGATIDRLASHPEFRAAARAMMLEAQSAAEALGIVFEQDLEARIGIGGMAGARKTSMLQDFERGKSLEIEPILGAVVELGELAGHAMPLCRAILALTRERAKCARTQGNAGPTDLASSI